MPSACTPFGSSVDKHTIAVRTAFASIGIHVPKIADDGKTAASLTENEPYHIAMIDGEAPLDPQANTELPSTRPGWRLWCGVLLFRYEKRFEAGTTAARTLGDIS
jgi:hypothetical protein